MATSVNVCDVEDWDGPFNVIHHFDDFFEASPQFLPSRGFNTNLRWCAILDPWEDGEFILIIVPNFVNAFNDAREDVGNLFIRSRTPAKVAIVACMKGNVAGVDGTSGLEC